jgi:hypothetical protein
VPTFDRLALFKREYRKLTPEQKARFRIAVAKLVVALSQAPPSLPGDPLVHPLAGHRGVYELRFAPDGRATFTFGAPVRRSEPHVIWRRIGGHDVLDRP